ncbi:MAG: CAP domain-containing protein [Vicinamibacterales bacterium]|nr:CAP domain-containing protein [Vicinamibacterales bacterium]
MNLQAASLLVLCAVLSAVGVIGDRVAPGIAGITPAQAHELVRAHNVWRERAGVPPVRWAADLAARAQARARELSAQGCRIAHGPLPRDIGENLFRVSALQYTGGRPDEVFDLTATAVVDAWGVESDDYSPSTGACAPGRQCGHYTQIVWAATTDIGCGMSVCPSLGQVWVCNYRPRGNVRLFGAAEGPSS